MSNSLSMSEKKACETEIETVCRRVSMKVAIKSKSLFENEDKTVCRRESGMKNQLIK